MKTVLWKKDINTPTACTILLRCADDCEVKGIIENYLTTINLYNEAETGIGSPIWLNDNRLYVMPVEFEALRGIAEVFDIKFVEEL